MITRDQFLADAQTVGAAATAIYPPAAPIVDGLLAAAGLLYDAIEGKLDERAAQDLADALAKLDVTRKGDEQAVALDDEAVDAEVKVDAAAKP